jgi:hypothetical protein
MKRIVASVGLVALGATGLQVASVSAQTGSENRPWSVGVALRGFYDDNINSVPRDSTSYQDAYGFEVSPSIGFNWTTEQTAISLGYMYNLTYYDKVPVGNTDKYDQDHSFTVLFNHTFSPRYQVSVKDSFVIGQQPDFLRAGNTFTVYQRVPGNNIRNFGDIMFDAQLTRELSVEIGYNNALYDYADSNGTAASPSLSGTNDRLENRAHLDLKWAMKPQTTALIGYEFSQVSYTANEPIGLLSDGTVLMSGDRNWRSHYGYVGVIHKFNPEFTGTVKGGIRYTEYYNDPVSNETDTGPYINLALAYAYAPESTFNFGFTQDLSATDVVGVQGNGYARSMETSTAYLQLVHRIVPKLFGSVLGQYQYSLFNGGEFNNDNEQYWLAGLKLAYQFNTHFSAETGYNYDNLDSQLPNRSFNKNRVYVGMNATY